MLLSARHDFPGEARDFHGPTSEAARTGDLGERKGHTPKELLKRTYSMFFRQVVPIAGLTRDEQNRVARGNLARAFKRLHKPPTPEGAADNKRLSRRPAAKAAIKFRHWLFFFFFFGKCRRRELSQARLSAPALKATIAIRALASVRG